MGALDRHSASHVPSISPGARADRIPTLGRLARPRRPIVQSARWPQRLRDLLALSMILVASCSSTEPAGSAIEAVVTPKWKVVQGADFDRDSLGDVLWNDPAGNSMAVWLLDGSGVRERGPVIPGPAGEGWVAVTAADFDADGMADVLWFNASTHEATVWLMEGTRVKARGPSLPAPGPSYAAVTAGDADGDGMADVVWHNAMSGGVILWSMDGTALRAAGADVAGASGQGWTFVTAADFDRDGLNDLVLMSTTTQELSVWLLDGLRLGSKGPPIPPPPGEGWTVTNAADFDADGLNDVLWSNGTTGEMTAWLMDGVHLRAAGPVLAGPPGPGWAAITAIDTDLDGMADVVWCDTESDQMEVWKMSAGSLRARGPVTAGPGGP